MDTEFASIKGNRSSGAFASIHWAVDIGSFVVDRQDRYYPLAHSVLIDLARHSTASTGEDAYPSIEGMAERWHRSTRDVRNALDRLEDLGLIEDTGDVMHRNGGEITVWRVLFRSEAGAALAELAVKRKAERRARSARSSRESRRRQRGVERVTASGVSSPSPQSPHLVGHVTAAGVSRDRANAAVTASESSRDRANVPRPDQGPDHDRTGGPDQGPDPRSAAPDRGRIGRPNFSRGVGALTATALDESESTALADPDPTEDFVSYVLGQLDVAPEDRRHATTTLMAFADRWPNALAIAELAFQLAPSMEGSMELAMFERQHDHLLAVPLSKRLEAA